MFDAKKDWLPIGSVVRLDGGERLVMIAGYMVLQAGSEQLWDYIGYLYPEGNQHEEAVFFQREIVDEIYQLGFIDADGLRALEQLDLVEPDYQQERAEIARQISGDDA